MLPSTIIYTTGKNTAKLRVGVRLSCTFDRASKVPHMRSMPAMKQTMTSTGRLSVCIVIRLHTIKAGHTNSRMLRVVNRNFRRNRMGKIIVMPTKEA